MMLRPTRDTVAGALGVALGAGLFALTWGLPRSPFVPIGPDFYPRIVLGATILLGAILVAGDLVHGRRQPVAAATPRNYRLVVLTFLAFGLYVLALPGLGFRIATFAFVAGLQVLLDPPRSAVRWLTIGIVAACMSVPVFVVFERWLSILLPRGSWTGV
jgi:putative tricarboxylic transport membrane protein